MSRILLNILAINEKQSHLPLDYLLYTPPPEENEKHSWASCQPFGGTVTPPNSRTPSPMTFGGYEDQIPSFNSVFFRKLIRSFNLYPAINLH